MSRASLLLRFILTFVISDEQGVSCGIIVVVIIVLIIIIVITIIIIIGIINDDDYFVRSKRVFLDELKSFSQPQAFVRVCHHLFSENGYLICTKSNSNYFGFTVLHLNPDREDLD